MKARLSARLQRLEAQPGSQPSLFRYGWLKPLPKDYLCTCADALISDEDGFHRSCCWEAHLLLPRPPSRARSKRSMQAAGPKPAGGWSAGCGEEAAETRQVPTLAI